jgi:hypothetical protein
VAPRDCLHLRGVEHWTLKGANLKTKTSTTWANPFGKLRAKIGSTVLKYIFKQILSIWNRFAIAIARVRHHLQVKINRKANPQECRLKTSGFGGDQLIFKMQCLDTLPCLSLLINLSLESKARFITSISS